MKDWQIRTLKTFIEAFGGVFVPELAMILTGNVPKEWTSWTCVLVAVVCPAIAAGITAAWNVILEHLREGKSE